MANQGFRQRLVISALIIGPLALYLVLRLNPAIDPIWDDSIFHFYIVSFTSLVALVVSLFILVNLGHGDARALFSSLGFAAIAGLFLVHGASTPGVLISGFNPAVGWSARLSLTAGAVLIACAVVEMSAETERRIIENRGKLWQLLLVMYALYIWVAFDYPEPLESLDQFEFTSSLLAVVTAGLLIWSAWLAWRRWRAQESRISLALVLALPWLAIAQISQYDAPLWAASWWLYHVLMLAAFVATMAALVMDYEEARDFRLTHYFVALGVIVSVGLVAVLSETAVRLSGQESLRWPMFGFSLMVLLMLFLVLFAIVQRAQRIIDERTAELEAQKQWRADLTNLVVHDLKTPLQSIFINLHLLLGGKVGHLSEEQHNRLERVDVNAKEMSNLVDNLLDVEKLEAGALEIRPMPCDLRQLLRESVESMFEMAEVREIRLVTDVPDILPALDADDKLLRRVMQNLLTNAVKFTPQDGEIRVVAEARDGGVTVSVIDAGPGVPVEERDRIFEKFRQVKGGSRRGFGLGLALCKLVIDAHGGRIWVEDGPNGGGSRFAFSLPRTRPVRG